MGSKGGRGHLGTKSALAGLASFLVRTSLNSKKLYNDKWVWGSKGGRGLGTKSALAGLTWHLLVPL